MLPVRSAAAVAMTAFTLLASAAASAAPAQAPAAFPYGLWRNPQDSVHVEVRRCGPGACGYVVWANGKAKADARAGGTDRLVGQQLFQNLQPAGRQWQGQIFVPDLGVVLPGVIDESADGALVASGCLMGNIGCKSQSWSRVAAASPRPGRAN